MAARAWWLDRQAPEDMLSLLLCTAFRHQKASCAGEGATSCQAAHQRQRPHKRLKEEKHQSEAADRERSQGNQRHQEHSKGEQRCDDSPQRHCDGQHYRQKRSCNPGKAGAGSAFQRQHSVLQPGPSLGQ